MRKQKWVNVLLVMTLVLFSVLPAQPFAVQAADAPTQAAWPSVFAPYTLPDGSAIYDPAADEHPTSTDITSGIDAGVGLLPSMYVASDGSNFFVRLRVKGDPYDRKGGFLSTVWLVKLLDSTGAHKATIGLNGKPTDKDYVYVANADGSNVEKVYEDVTASNTVPGTRIVNAENGHYFIDFQVPVAKVISIIDDTAITNATDFKLEFGTSRAANLSVINKETMDTVSSDGGASIQLTQTPISISIDGGSSKEYSVANNIMTGTSSLANGTASISINGGTSVNVTITNNTWSYTLPSDITSTNGVHKATVTLTNNDKTVIAKQDVMVSNAVENLFIDGGLVAYTGNVNYVLKGSFNTTKASNNYDIEVTVVNKNGVAIVNNQTVGTKDNTTKTWSYGTVNLGTPTDGDKFSITAISGC